MRQRRERDGARLCDQRHFTPLQRDAPELRQCDAELRLLPRTAKLAGRIPACRRTVCKAVLQSARRPGVIKFGSKIGFGSPRCSDETNGVPRVARASRMLVRASRLNHPNARRTHLPRGPCTQTFAGCCAGRAARQAGRPRYPRHAAPQGACPRYSEEWLGSLAPFIFFSRLGPAFNHARAVPLSVFRFPPHRSIE